MSFLRISLALIIIATATVPYSTHAASSDQSLLARSSRTSGERYSSSVTREIKKLDSKAVKDLPIPILLGVRVSNLSPNFGDPRDGGSRSHEGLDIMSPMGSFISSPTEAVVVRTGKGDSSGTYVTTANPGGETFTYMHLSGIADGVKTGTVLKTGDLIGYVGDTGNAKGGAPHLHFEIRKSRKATDPFPRLTKEFSSAERLGVLKDILADLQKELARKSD